MLRVLALVLLCPLPGQDALPRAELAALLQRHARAIGADALAAVGNLRVTASLDVGGRTSTIRMFVRREPFAFRRELETKDGPAPAIGISDGHLAWDASGRLLPAAAARELLDEAFLQGLLYLDPARISAGPDTRAPWPLRDHEGVLPAGFPTGLRTNWVALSSPGGRLLQLHFDADSYLLVEIADADAGPAWARFADCERFGGLLLPTARAAGVVGRPETSLWRARSVETNVALPDELFAGCPLPPAPPLQRAGRLQLCASSLPGSAVLVLPEAEISGRPVVALVDTGATRCALQPALAQVLALPRCAPMQMATISGQVAMYTAWVDEISCGERRLLQRIVPVVDLPGVLPLPRDRQPGLLLASDVLGDSPVFDFVRGELLLRGKPVTPLADLAGDGERVVTAPLEHAPLDAPYVTIEINGVSFRAVLDTGLPWLMRVSKSALQRCGLPADAAAWRARGAGLCVMQEPGGRKVRDLTARLDSFRLGPVRFLGPLVQLAGLEADAPVPARDVFVGCGLLLPFLRVGLDYARGRIEFDPGAAVRRADDGVLEVPPFGELLGLGLGAPMAAAPGGLVGLPSVEFVMEGTPAARAGLKAGELLRRIGGKSCAGMSGDEVARMLWVRAGEVVEVEVIGMDGQRRVVRLP